jgi:hypothetical protein
MTEGWSVRWKLTCLCLASAVLTACASGPRPGARRELRLDTETASQLKHAAAAAETASGVAVSTTRAVVSNLVRNAPWMIRLMDGEDQVSHLEELLVECARYAERKVNGEHFGDRSPTRQECGEEVEVDGCAEPITRAMLLGQQKHALALECARDVLKELWPTRFSIEQRYRYYPNAQFLEFVSAREEADLLAQGCTLELWRTIKPDILLHADNNWRRAALILEYKFPCPETNAPQWRVYGDDSAYAGYSQDKIYKEALGGDAFLISSARGVTR